MGLTGWPTAPLRVLGENFYGCHLLVILPVREPDSFFRSVFSPLNKNSMTAETVPALFTVISQQLEQCLHVLQIEYF